MDIEKYRNYCIAKRGVTESFPFPNLPNVLVFKVAGKMFTATDATSFATISVRCDSEKVDEMRAKYPAVIKPGYFSERHWSWIVMDNSIPDKRIFEWIDDSYQLAIAKLTKKTKLELKL
ncbi:MAG: MmcQ/YjbR family DNA-binding protein [Bacteroidetes bacterium]|nr:MmcQ/YjbR family DNA-binding protein [Bacteroidota bacterium]